MFGFPPSVSRVYKRVFGSRKYVYYSPETLEACLNAVSPYLCTLKDAEAVFGISKRIICYKRNQVLIRKPKRPLVISNEEEKTVASCIV
ncbi:hypothetical protein AVEN_53199-1 [Araneus ventricosus]|uniref:HTH psq-type domain-containing protein n=1 Tax=Araneus ventricosus TaxID=182803 RepID=A0A4Y2AAS1_ARAVE|nr:hypothetical protein AVEN_53199-1 [Araneus ventricosus]